MTESITASNISRKWILSPLGVMYLFPAAVVALGYIAHAFNGNFDPPEWLLAAVSIFIVVSVFVETFALIVGWTALATRPSERSRRSFALVAFGTLAFVVYVAGVGYAITRPIA
jgi:hypothetical protein